MMWKIKVSENLSIAENIYNGLGILYGNYKERYFLWESLEMTKKVLLASITVFIGERSYTLFALLITFSGMFATLHAHFQASASTAEYFLQLVCLSALHIHLLLGLSMKNGIPCDSVGHRTGYLCPDSDTNDLQYSCYCFNFRHDPLQL